MVPYTLKKIICSLFVLFAILLSFTAETFRVHKTVTAVMQEQTDSFEVQLGINDALAISLPKNREFLKGLEFEITIPQVVVYYRGAIAWSFYNTILPVPEDTVIDYSGKKLYLDTFPGQLSYNFKIPFVSDNNLKSSPYTTILPQLYTQESALVFLRFQLAMKGTSEDLYNAVFTVQVKPVLYDEGLLVLDLQYPEYKSVNITDKSKPAVSSKGKMVLYIDEQPITEVVDTNIKPIRLSTGTHHLSIVSDNYRNEVRTFTINQAETSKVSVVLRDVAPLVSISAPSTAKIFLDAKEVVVTNKELSVVPGEHKIRFVIGDYELVKTFNAENGKTYTVGVSMSVDISEKK
jgi:hypothetical protein